MIYQANKLEEVDQSPTVVMVGGDDDDEPVSEKSDQANDNDDEEAKDFNDDTLFKEVNL